MNNNRNIVFILIFLSMVSLLIGITYSFFNYTRTGSSNTITVGRINFITRQTETINLTNVFPIDRSTIDSDTDNVDEVVIEIEGDTDYSNGIEYLVSSVDSEIYTSSGKLVPISLDVTVTELGTASPTYFTARDNTNASIYKKLVGDTLVGDQMILVGYIVPNTTLGTASGIDGSITIKAFFDKNVIGISDTYDGTESDNMGTTEDWADGRTILTTTEWNAIQSNGVSFKIKVEANEGIWVTGSLEEIMRTRAVMDNINSTYVNNSTPGIDFTKSSSDTNGKGVYTRAGTENDTNPIMYYRGDIDNNNVLFGDYCWKAVRTTEDGGVKLLYNGEYGNIYERIPLEESEYSIVENTNDAYIYDSTNKWFTITSTSVFNGDDYNLIFTLPDGKYIAELTGQLIDGKDEMVGIYDEDDINVHSSDNTTYINEYAELNSLNKNSYTVWFYTENYQTEGVVFHFRIYALGDSIGVGCENKKINPGIKDENNNELFPFSIEVLNESISRVGYMQGESYQLLKAYPTNGAYFGNSFSYNNGVYNLVDTRVGANASHHYTCNLTTTDGTCATIRYYYASNYYINLSNGENISDALEKMFQNNTDSTAKSVIDSWYSQNMTSYTNKLEDSIWCNDRTIINYNGFDPNEGSLNTKGVLFNGSISASSTTIQLICPNKRDSFTMNNSNGNTKLTYPIALLTVDEAKMVGAKEYGDTTSYVYNGSSYSLISPAGLYGGNRVDTIRLYEVLSSIPVFNDYGKIRPAITLKHGTNVIKGDGTEFNPYVIE